MSDLTWSCECGQVEARFPAKGNRIVCYCDSCREFVVKLGSADRLDQWGGSELLQTMPQDVTITKGQEHLAHTRLTDKGPLRWYAGCCDTPMANTMASRSFPFASFQTHDIEPKTALPPLKGQVNLSGATGRIENVRKVSIPGLIRDLLLGTAKAYLKGKIKKNPFFDATGAPIGPRREP